MLIFCISFHSLAGKLNNNQDDILISEEAYLFSFCLNPESICSTPPNPETYRGMKGKLESPNPVKTDFGKNIFKFNMQNGKSLYLATESTDPLKSMDIIHLSTHNNTLSKKGTELVKGTGIFILDIDHVDGVGYRYSLSTGMNVFGDELKNIESLLKVVPAKDAKTIASLLSNRLRVRLDDVENKFYIQLDNSMIMNNSLIPPLQPYIIYKNKEGTLVNQYYYKATNWLFINKILVKYDSDFLSKEKLSINQDNDSMNTWEWHANFASKDDLMMLKGVADSNNAVVRFYGKNYYSDREVTDFHKRQISSILEIHEILNQKRS